MAKSYPSQLNPGAFIPTTYIWEVAQLQDIDVNTPEFKELLVRLYQNINNIALALNIKDTGYYVLEEFLTGQLFFPNPTLSSSTSQTPTFRQTFRKTIDFGALPNAGTKSVAHGIEISGAAASQYTFTRIYGAASDTTGLAYIPIPYASPTLANNIELRADATNVTIITGSNRSNFNQCYVVCEYIKQ